MNKQKISEKRLVLTDLVFNSQFKYNMYRFMLLDLCFTCET